MGLNKFNIYSVKNKQSLKVKKRKKIRAEKVSLAVWQLYGAIPCQVWRDPQRKDESSDICENAFFTAPQDNPPHAKKKEKKIAQLVKGAPSSYLDSVSFDLTLSHTLDVLTIIAIFYLFQSEY